MKICKFGGSSVASAQQIRKTAKIVLSDPLRRLVVVSAPGKRFTGDQKVTDLLIELGQLVLSFKNYQETFHEIINRFASIIIELKLDHNLIDQMAQNLKARLEKTALGAPKFMDLIKATGEEFCAKIVVSYFQSLNVDAQYLDPWNIGLILSDEPGNAYLLPSSYQNLQKIKESKTFNSNTIGVVPGFFGYNLQGEVVTFARGGSDITGSILASAVDAQIYENFTDVDHVYIADPRIVSNSLPIYQITYKEMRELSYAGFSVLHEEALEPLYKKSIPLVIKNTNNCDAVGTYIVPQYQDSKVTLSGIAGRKGFASIYLGKYLMNREIGFGRRLLQILEDERISFDHTPSGIDNISVIIDGSQLSPAIENKLLYRFREELHVDYVDIAKNLALIMVVGENIFQDGAIAKVTNVLNQNDINVKILSKASFSVSLMVGIEEQYLEKAIKVIYQAFYPDSV